ncbi:MAG TPA: exodeoxyribonuclease V subunit gamma [Jiangellales bacterium]|nr:exodeoxyribonuclease V subunit gamma [Jiangellales bacterium]
MLHVHRAERADRLVDGLAALLAGPAADPFAPEVVAVPARGVERWVTQRLSHVLGAGPRGADGVCADVLFPHPSRLVAEVVARAAGMEPDDDPWDPDRVVWPLLDTVDAYAPEPWCRALAGHVGVDPDDPRPHRRGRRLSAARHLATLYDSYAAHRPGMLTDWLAGHDTDGAGADLPDDLRWQAELWRRLRGTVGLPSRAERLGPACERLRTQPGLVELPDRLSVLFPTRLTTAQLRVLDALATQREVHLWLPHPSPVLWSRISRFGTGPGPNRRRTDPTAGLPRNPLLAGLGRDSRELQLQLSEVVGTDEHLPLAPTPDTLLGRVQRAVRDDLPYEDAPPSWSIDPSLQVHACHGPERQVEVLREVLVGLLADDPSLEPRDVLVMCPDIEEYAPLISATFGLADDRGPGTHPGHRLRVRLADRALRQTNSLLATVAALLELADARVTASQVLDLAASPPVRRRFRLTDDNLERLHQWARDAGVRWGLDAGHRAPYGLATVPQNTWSTSLDRILLGAAMADEAADPRWVGLALPLDDVDSSDIGLAGRLAELVDRLAATLTELTGERPLTAWLETLTAGLDRLTEVTEADAWQRAQARRELAAVAAEAGARAGSVPLSLADLRVLLADRLRGRPTRANFRTGELTVCSMVPMRSVPHRVVCLLGLDDGHFPRTVSVDGDDVLAREPCVGERDRRSEDRQLFLDAVLAARDHLVVLYTGADPRTNARRPPAVPVGELLDAADVVARPTDGGRTRDHVVVHHPLQPFDARNFEAGRLGAPGPFSFDRQGLAGAQRAAEPRDEPAPFLDPPLDPPDESVDLPLDDLVAFLEHPAKAFLRQRLGITLLRDEEELDDDLAVELTALDRWSVGDRLLRARLGGADLQTCRDAEWRRQTLPPRELGRRVVTEVVGQVEPLVAAAAAVRTGAGRAVDVTAEAAGRRVVGTVGIVHGSTLVRAEFSRLAAKHRLRAWAQLLALAASSPETSWTAVTIGRGSKDGVARSCLGPVDPAEASRHLADLVALRASGLCAPLPVAVKTSAAYAEARVGGMSPANALAKARRAWQPDRFDGEQADPAHRLVWGDQAALDLLVADPGAGDEPHRFGELARRLWDPLLAAEDLQA